MNKQHSPINEQNATFLCEQTINEKIDEIEQGLREMEKRWDELEQQQPKSPQHKQIEYVSPGWVNPLTAWVYSDSSNNKVKAAMMK